jgi:hypothetical protein
MIVPDVQRSMSGTEIVLVRRGVSGLIAYLGRNSERVQACGTCHTGCEFRKRERYVGFCHDCLDRSRIAADDDIGGES